MFSVPTALEKLRNKEQQYEAAVKDLHQASTYTDILKWFRRVRKQYYQYQAAKQEYEKQSIEKLDEPYYNGSSF